MNGTLHMPSSKAKPTVATLGSLIHRLSDDVQQSLDAGAQNLYPQAELLDALDDLRAELVGPMRWPGTFLAPPELAALQVAFNRKVFQLVPLVKGSPIKPSITTKELASRTGVASDLILRIMRTLTVNKIFEEVDEQVFAHSEISAALADDVVGARPGSIFNDLFKAASALDEAIDKGSPSAWHARFGMPLYEYFEKNPNSDRDRMAKAMIISSTEEIQELAEIFPWRDFRKIVDIGGGAGHLAVHLTQQFPHLQAVNQDLPKVIDDQIHRIARLAPDEAMAYTRVQFQVHSYYETQPPTDADAFILRRCLHNNPDAECVRILKAVAPALAPRSSLGARRSSTNKASNARLLINEKLIPPRDPNAPRWKTKMIRREDMTMMISCGGKERSLEEFERLVREADPRLEIEKVYHGKNHFAVISVKMGDGPWRA